MTVGFYNLKSNFNGDRESLTTATLPTYKTWTTGTAYQYNSTTAKFEPYVSGDKYEYSGDTVNIIDDTVTTVSAEFSTVDIIANNDIMQEVKFDSLYLKTGIANNSFDIYKLTDFFSQENTVYDTITFYNDAQEINSGVTTAIFGGSRSSIVHSEIPLGSDIVKSLSLILKSENEAQIDFFKLVTSDAGIGGDY